MELRNLRTFLSVAEHMSFNRAAAALHYAQSTVSAQVQALEEELGARLFERLGRRVTLTEAGRSLLAYARKLTELEREAATAAGAAAQAGGTLTVRVPESLCAWRFPALVEAFRGSYPRVGLRFETCALHGLEEDLRRGVTDLAFLLYDSVSSSGLEVELLGEEELVLAAPPGHGLAGRTALAPDDLAGETLLFSSADCSYRAVLEAELQRAGVRTGAVLEYGSVHALLRAVAAGLGIAPLVRLGAAEAAARGEVSLLPWPDGPRETGLLMVRHKEKWVSPLLAAFMDAARETLASPGRLARTGGSL